MSTERIAASPMLRGAVDEVAAGVFSPDDRSRYRGLVDTLRHHDYFMVCADFDAYLATQRGSTKPGATRSDGGARASSTPRNVGWFSSDRTIAEYAERDLERAVPAARLISGGRHG